MEDGVSMTTASSGEVGVDFNMDLGTNALYSKSMVWKLLMIQNLELNLFQ